jgi:hypothetical protein
VEWRLQQEIGTLLKRRIAHEQALWKQWPHVYMGRDKYAALAPSRFAYPQKPEVPTS